jgi:hypothetical protein
MAKRVSYTETGEFIAMFRQGWTIDQIAHEKERTWTAVRNAIRDNIPMQEYTMRVKANHIRGARNRVAGEGTE